MSIIRLDKLRIVLQLRRTLAVNASIGGGWFVARPVFPAPGRPAA